MEYLGKALATIGLACGCAYTASVIGNEFTSVAFAITSMISIFFIWGN
jgi:hypothetical protein